MKRLITLFILVCAFGTGPSTRALADDVDSSALDVSFKFGGVFGSVTTLGVAPATTNGAPQAALAYDFGGIPIELGLNRDLSTSFSAYLGFQILADIENFQIGRTGFNLQFAYHLFGGPRRMMKEIGTAEVVTRESSNFSLLFGGSFQQYGARAKTGAEQLVGTAFAVEGGIQYRFDTSDTAAISIELVTTLIPLAASAEQTIPSLTSFFINYRFFL